MKMHMLVAAFVLVVTFTACADELPSLDKDYYSLQIASGQDAKPLETLYQHFTDLPFVRIERRGTLYVLRAGFWPNRAAAQGAISKIGGAIGFVRLAVLRPDTIVQKNWLDDAPVNAADADVPVRAGVPLKPKRTQASKTLPSTAQEPGSNELLPFNQEDYLLAYDVFVGSGDLEQAYRVAEKAARQAPQDQAWQQKLATVAAWTQRHEVASEYYFLAMQQASDQESVRRLFMAGVDSLMAGSRFKQAIEAADKNIGTLANDPATLRFLARTALAAGEPARAASYIDKLVFRSKATQGKP